MKCWLSILAVPVIFFGVIRLMAWWMEIRETQQDDEVAE